MILGLLLKKVFSNRFFGRFFDFVPIFVRLLAGCFISVISCQFFWSCFHISEGKFNAGFLSFFTFKNFLLEKKKTEIKINCKISVF